MDMESLNISPSSGTVALNRNGEDLNDWLVLHAAEISSMSYLSDGFALIGSDLEISAKSFEAHGCIKCPNYRQINRAATNYSVNNFLANCGEKSLRALRLVSLGSVQLL